MKMQYITNISLFIPEPPRDTNPVSILTGGTIMKKILSLTLAMALMAAAFTGCACEANVSTHPGGMITEESTRPSIMPHPTATHETTRPTQATLPQATMPTVTGSEPVGGTSKPTDDTADTTPTDTTMDARHRTRNSDR